MMVVLILPVALAINYFMCTFLWCAYVFLCVKYFLDFTVLILDLSKNSIGEMFKFIETK